jgi:hypothetical protein
MIRPTVAAVAIAAVLGSVVLTGPGPSAAAEPSGGCPNEAIREQQSSTFLPECRAYEMVSPNGSAPIARWVAALDGERFAYFSYNPYPGQGTEAMSLLSTRGQTGWVTQGTTPPESPLRESESGACSPAVYYSAELTLGVLADGYRQGGLRCYGDEPELVEGEPRGVANLFLRDNEAGTYRLIDPWPLGGAEPQNAFLLEATPDMSHVVFLESARLTADAPVGGGEDLYEWSAGVVRLVSVLPDGTGSAGQMADVSPSYADGTSSYRHALSADGERVFFDVGGVLYVRLNAMQPQSRLVGGACVEPALACTVQIDAAQPGAEGASGGGRFQYAAEDGSRVFFTDESRLTVGSTAAANEPDLYEYDLETGVLSDLTVDASEPADVRAVVGESADGSYLYFLADGVLPGVHANSQGVSAVAGQANLYVRHGGVTSFIATVGGEELTARVSPNGRFIAFNSALPLTKYDNQPAEPGDCKGSACGEIFLYEAGGAQLRCVSCAADGAPPTGPAGLTPPETTLFYGGPEMLSRNVLDSGQVFFDSGSPLVGSSPAGVQNVYEYREGQVALISTGQSPQDAEFLDASANGENVFFRTDQALVSGDTDNGLSVYDARVNGGFPALPGERGQAGECEDIEACRSPLREPPVRAFGASRLFSGPGDLTFSETVPTGPSGGEGKGKSKHVLTRAQKLKRALKACGREPKRRRAACRRRARKRFGPIGKRHGKRGGRR